MAHLRDSGLSADAAAGLVLARIKTCVSRRLAGIAEAFSAEEREQNRDGLGSETGDAVQQQRPQKAQNLEDGPCLPPQGSLHACDGRGQQDKLGQGVQGAPRRQRKTTDGHSLRYDA
ncbi:hypothetical protein LDFHOB_11330 [Candidatus Electronema aureum]